MILQVDRCAARLGVVGSFLALVLAAQGGEPSSRPRAYPNGSILVEPDDLRDRLGDPRLVLLDTRPRREYDAGHIRDARWLDADAWEKHAAQAGGLRDAAGWSEVLGRLGVSPARDVVVYGAELRTAARVWWLLRYLGVERARLLNGGWDVWRKQGLPTSTEAPTIHPTTFAVHFQVDRLAGKDYVLRAIRSGLAAVCDARTEAEYTGRLKQAKRGGHIPTAHALNWKDLLGPDGRIKPAAELRDLLARAGVEPGKPAVTYCQSGGRASVDALVLELMGSPEVRNYYASWNEWGNAQDTPIETGGAPARRRKDTPK